MNTPEGNFCQGILGLTFIEFEDRINIPINGISKSLKDSQRFTRFQSKFQQQKEVLHDPN
jgi:hypothetical protein